MFMVNAVCAVTGCTGTFTTRSHHLIAPVGHHPAHANACAQLYLWLCPRRPRARSLRAASPPWQLVPCWVLLTLLSSGSKVLSSASEVVVALELRTTALHQPFVPSLGAVWLFSKD